MDDSDAVGRPEAQLPSRKRLLTPRRVVAAAALVFLLVRHRRQLRLVRDAFRHRRRLKLALTVLVLLRQFRRS